MDAFHDDPLTGLQALVNEPLIALPTGRLNRPHLDLVVLTDNEDHRTLGPLLDRPLRHQNRRRFGVPFDADSHELSRK